MSAESLKHVVRRFNSEVIEAGNRMSFDDLMDPAFVNRSAPPGASNGPESLWNTFQNVLRPALSNLRVEILDQLCEGDRVATHKMVCGRHTGSLLGIPSTGRAVAIEVMDVVRLRNGKYLEHWGVNTLPAVLVQLRSP